MAQAEADRAAADEAANDLDVDGERELAEASAE
jgi:hypothetical protein